MLAALINLLKTIWTIDEFNNVPSSVVKLLATRVFKDIQGSISGRNLDKRSDLNRFQSEVEPRKITTLVSYLDTGECLAHYYLQQYCTPLVFYERFEIEKLIVEKFLLYI